MSKTNDGNLSPGDIYDDMEVLEPYTEGELASKYDAPKQRIRNLLERLSDLGKIWKKEPEPERSIWIHDAPIHECSECGYNVTEFDFELFSNTREITFVDGHALNAP